MTIIVKQFRFERGNEGWDFITPSSHVIGFVAAKQSRATGKQGGPFGTSLCIVARSGAPASAVSWEWRGTWEQFGIPPNADVISIQGEYLYRWSFQDQNQSLDNEDQQSYAEFEAGAAGVGPFEFLRDDGIMVGQFSESHSPPARGLPAERLYYLRYPDPLTGIDGGIPLDNPTWKQVTGSVLSIPTNMRSSFTRVRLALRAALPATAIWQKTGTVAERRSKFIRLKLNQIQFTLEYER